MKRAMLSVLMMSVFGGLAVAAPTEWWNAAYNSASMLNKDQATTWRAENGDTLSRIVMSSYGIPADKMQTTLKVVDALVAYNNALQADRSLYDADKVTPIVDRNKIYAGKTYFMPDPRSLDRIMRGEDPATVMRESLTSAQNAAQARGEAGTVPMHATSPIDVAASDNEVAPTPTPTPTGTANGTPAAPILGGWNAQNGQGGPGLAPAELAAQGRTDMLGVQSMPGATRADGATPEGDTPVERNRRGNVPLICMWDFVNAEPVTKTAGPAKGAAQTGVNIGQSN